MTIDAVVAAGAVGCTVVIAGNIVVVGRANRLHWIRPHLAVARARLGSGPTDAGPVDRRSRNDAWGPRRILAAAAGMVDRRRDATLEVLLTQAGVAPPDPHRFRATELRAVAIGATGGAVFGAVTFGTPVVALVTTMFGAFIGVTRVRAGIDRAREQRRRRMESELVGLDLLLALHVRSGAGPVQAVERVCARGDGVVVAELRDILDRIRSGDTEADAYRWAASRTVSPSAARTYALIATASERGADLGAALLAAASELRAERRERAHRQATKRRAAMLLPTVGILAPVMLLLVAAPLPSIVLGTK